MVDKIFKNKSYSNIKKRRKAIYFVLANQINQNPKVANKI